MIPFSASLFGQTAAAGGGATDPNFASTVLLLSGDGTNGSTTFTDESHSAHGSASTSGAGMTVSTSTVKFGTGSMHFSGTTDHLTYANSADWQLGSGDFTIEAWCNFASSSGLQIIASLYSTVSSQRSWYFAYNAGALQFAGSSNGSSAANIVSQSFTPTTGQWYHLACDRSGNVFRVYVDGAMLGTSATNSITLFNSTTLLRIGDNVSTTDTNFFNGNMDELRITKGVARYASDSGYTVPTAAFPRS